MMSALALGLAFACVAGVSAQAGEKTDEFRGAWIATVANTNWPEKGASADSQKAAFANLMDQAEAMNLNAAVVQIRPTADAFYQSELNPWSEYLTGTQGKDPGYDPLAFMVEEAHKRGLEFHAWFNPFRVSTDNGKKKLGGQQRRCAAPGLGGYIRRAEMAGSGASGCQEIRCGQHHGSCQSL
jgi:uncharacterized lipoprotein YddW (UPF0748 family)